MPTNGSAAPINTPAPVAPAAIGDSSTTAPQTIDAAAPHVSTPTVGGLSSRTPSASPARVGIATGIGSRSPATIARGPEPMVAPVSSTPVVATRASATDSVAPSSAQSSAQPPDSVPDPVWPAPSRATRRQRQRQVIDTTIDTEATHDVQAGTTTPTQLPLPAPMHVAPTNSTNEPAAENPSGVTPIATTSSPRPSSGSPPARARGGSPSADAPRTSPLPVAPAVLREPAAPSTTTPLIRRRSRR